MFYKFSSVNYLLEYIHVEITTWNLTLKTENIVNFQIYLKLILLSYGIMLWYL